MESTDFGIRQAVILKEKPEQSFVRWVRIIIRSAPMTLYLLPLPFAITYRWLPGASHCESLAILVTYVTVRDGGK